jgi:hypothetical protein
VDYIKQMIDASLDKSDSLADVSEYALAAQGMYELGAVLSCIMYESQTRDYLMSAPAITGPRIKDFLTVGIGFGKDETGIFFALVLVYENSADAQEGVSLLERKVDLFNTYCNNSTYGINHVISSTDICTDGRVLLAKLYSKYDDLWEYWFFNWWQRATSKNI